MKKINFIIFIAGLVLLASFWLLNKDEAPEMQEKYLDIDIPGEVVDEKRDEILGTEEIKQIPEKEIEEEIVVPESIKIEVPFTSQAPFGVWDERHEEACEEASLLMVIKYLSKETLTPEISEKELQEMIDFQIDKYGDYKDSDMQGVIELAKDFYNVDSLDVIYDFKKDDIKKELAKGSPVIIPTAGRLLGNPYFTPPGPLYHNLVLVGFDGDNIITNDPGTKRGEGYVYDLGVLYDSIHDFTGKKDDIESGRKAMIVIRYKI